MERLLVLGYGNPGRLDDGLGVALAEALECEGLDGVTVEADYQLTVEDAEAVARHDAVVFVDACVDGPAPFTFRAVEPEAEMSVGFSSHHLEPPAVLALARDLFGAVVPAYTLGIRGYAFDAFGEGLSAGARGNLAAAADFLLPVLRERRFAAAATPTAGDAGVRSEEC
jgi:hydrogenase maturation protease